MSRSLPPRGSTPPYRSVRPVCLPRPGTLTAGELSERARLTGREPLELLAEHILSGHVSEPVQHPLRRVRGDTARELATVSIDGLSPPTRDWFKLGRE